MKPGFHPGMPMADYLAAPAVSAGMLLTLLERCPRAAWHDSWLNPKHQRDDSTAEQDAGTIAHACLLEGSMECVAVIDPKDHPNEDGKGHAKGWTNKSIKAAREAAVVAGKVPVLPERMAKITAMVEAARAYIDSLRTGEPAIWTAFQQGCGESELTMVWQERNGVLCRARPDRISKDRRVIIDYKSVGGTSGSAHPDTWGRKQLVNMGYYIGAAFYRRGAKALTGEDCAYVYLVQEQEPPYLCSLVGIDRAGESLGDARIGRALDSWASCAKSGNWPAYPARVAYPEMPAYEMAKEEEAEAHGLPFEIEKMGWREARESAERNFGAAA
jgi:hypothetical protein